jgi:hypothetical protein
MLINFPLIAIYLPLYDYLLPQFGSTGAAPLAMFL